MLAEVSFDDQTAIIVLLRIWNLSKIGGIISMVQIVISDIVSLRERLAESDNLRTSSDYPDSEGSIKESLVVSSRWAILSAR